MATNQKFENAARLRSRLAFLIALVIHIGLIGFLWVFNGDGPDLIQKIKPKVQQSEIKP